MKKAIPSAHWEIARNLKACVEYCSKVDTRKGETICEGFTIPEVIDTISIEEFEDWQEEIYEMILGTPHKRHVYWYWEEKGGVGKTEFCKFLCVKHPDILYVNGKAADMKFAIAKFVEEHKRGPKACLMDFPRDYQTFVSYMGIEEIKNGIFFSGKYESGQCIYNTPHVICFANFRPFEQSLSADRWKIVDLNYLHE